MKKTKVMRLLSLLLVMTLISTCAISGTFAKYVTRAEGEDQARVAKWGVLVSVQGDKLFAPEYEKDDDTFKGQGATATVRVDPDYEGKITDLVAPGTTNDGFKASIVGKPEVAVRYILHIDKDWTDVVLPKGEYTDFTHLAYTEPSVNAEGNAVPGSWGYTDTFNLDKDYAPVKWDITVSKNGGTPISLVGFARQFNEDLAEQMGMTKDGFSAADAKTIVATYKTQLESLILAMLNNDGEAGASNAQFTVNEDGSIDLSIDFDANRSLNFEFALKWTWAFENGEEIEDGIYQFDAADTWLGNYAAYKEFGEASEYADEFNASNAIYTIGLKFTATAVQID